MNIAFTVTFAIFATSCTLCGCIEEKYLGTKVGIESKHALSEADTELMMKSLMAKLEHGAADSELLHKSADKEYYLHSPEMMDKVPFGKEEEMKYLEKSIPIEHEYKLTKDLVKDGYEIKADTGLAEKDMEAFLMKIKELGGSKMLEDEYKKGMYYGAPEEKFLSGEVYLAEDAAKKEMSKKMLEEALKSKETYGLGEAYGFEMDKKARGIKAYSSGEEAGIALEKALYGEEALKSKETRGSAFDFEMGKKLLGTEVAFDDKVKHSVYNPAEAEKAFKIYEDELIKKDKSYGTDALFYKDKEILGTDHYARGMLKDEEAKKFYEATADKHLIASKDGIIGAEKTHISFEDPKAKFFELLRRVIHTRKCHLVTMSAGELLSVVNCVSISKDPLLCEKFATCEKKMPIRVIKALEKCQKETIPGEIKRCSRYAPLYPSPIVPLKIFQCMAITVGELVVPEEKKEMIAFEECAKVLKAESCGRFKWSSGPY